MSEVVIEQPGVPSITVPLGAPEIALGRAEDNDVVLVAEEVSRYHAKLLLHGSRYILQDLSSLNGTYVNRQRVVKRVLSHLDEVWFGSKCRMTYRDETSVHQPFTPSEATGLQGSTITDSLASISQEMEDVGNQLTMITKRGPGDSGFRSGLQSTPAPGVGELEKMSRAFRRLDALYKVTKIIASDFDLPKRLAQVLDTTMEAVDAERGFIMLWDESGGELRPTMARAMGRDLEASSPSMSIANRAATTGEPVLVKNTASDTGYSASESIIVQRIRSAMCAPLKIEDRVLGSIYVDVRESGDGFHEEDLELFTSMAAQSSMAIENVRLYEQMVESEKQRANLGRFLSPSIVEQIMQHTASLELGGTKRSVTAMFCDIRGFTGIAERMAPVDLVALLNEHFTAMTAIVFRYSGTLDKYIGDEIMAVFGSPISAPDDTVRAVLAAIDMQDVNRELNEQRRAAGRPLLEMGIGIATGEVIAGYVGSPDRMEFTVIGDRVNTARRFCSVAEANQIVAGEETYEAVKNQVETRDLGTVALKGKEEAVRAFEILGSREFSRGGVGSPG